MQQRLSIVDHLNVISEVFSSVLQIGDSNMVLPYSKVLAVQREHEVFYGKEGRLDNPIYYEPIPRPIITEQVLITRINESPQIHVHSITIIGISTASVVHIGSTNVIHGEARVRNVRHLRYGRAPTEETVEIIK